MKLVQEISLRRENYTTKSAKRDVINKKIYIL